jgi:hypothetical protein
MGTVTTPVSRAPGRYARRRDRRLPRVGIDRPESRGTLRQYTATLRRFRQALGAGVPVGSIDDAAVRTAFV